MKEFFSDLIFGGTSVAKTFYESGIAKFNRKQYVESIEDFNKALALDPPWFNTFFWRGLARLELNLNVEAIEDFETVLKSFSLNPMEAIGVLLYLGVARSRLKQYSEAITAYNEITQSVGSESELNEQKKIIVRQAFILRSQIKADLNQDVEAIQDLDEALLISVVDEDNEIQSSLLIKRAQLKQRIGKYAEAIQDYDIAESLSGFSCTQVFVARGDLKIHLKQYTEAREDYDKALKLDPKLIPALLQHAKMSVLLKDYAKANSDYTSLLDIKPDLRIAWISRGNLNFHLAHYADAIKDYDKVMRIEVLEDTDDITSNDLFQVLSRRCFAKYSLRDYENAKKDCELAIQSDKKNAKAFYYRALIHEKLGNEMESYLDFETAYTLFGVQNQNLCELPLLRVILENDDSAFQGWLLQKATCTDIQKTQKLLDLSDKLLANQFHTLQGKFPMIEDKARYENIIHLYKNGESSTRGMFDINQKPRLTQLKTETVPQPISGWRLIHLAAWHLDIPTVKKFLNSDVHLGIADDGWTPLHSVIASPYSLESEVKELANLLCEYGVSLDAKTIIGDTVLHLAIKQGSLERVRYVMFKNPLLTYEVNHLKEYPGDLIKEKDSLLLDILDQGKILAAAQMNKAIDIKTLYRKNPLLLTVVNMQGDTPFIIAVKHGSTEVINDLIELSRFNQEVKIDRNFINVKNKKNGDPALHIAVRRNDIETIKKLIKQPSFNINEQNHLGQTGLHIAILEDKKEIAELLLLHHAVLDDILAKVLTEKDALSFTPIQLAVRLNRYKLMDLFSGDKCKNSKHPFYGSLLYLAIEFNAFETFNHLVAKNDMRSQLEEGVTLPEFNLKGIKPLGYAAYRGRIDFFSCIMSYGISLMQKNDEENTAMHLAILGGQELSIKTLDSLDSTSNLINMPNKHGEQPLGYARKFSQFNDPNTHFLPNLITHLLKSGGMSQEIEYQKLSFQGGGPKGIAYLGPLQQMAREGRLEYIDGVAGTSAGGITAGMLAIGLSPFQMEKELKAKPLIELLDYIDKNVTPETIKKSIPKILEEKPRKPNGKEEWFEALKFVAGELGYMALGFGNSTLGFMYNKILENNALCYGKDALDWIEGIIYAKTEIRHFTLGDLKDKVRAGEKGYRHIKLYGSRIDGYMKNGTPILSLIEFSSENDGMRDFILSDLIRLSMSIPILFLPHLVYRRHPDSLKRVPDALERFFDGGLLNNGPVDAFDDYPSPFGHNDIHYSTRDNKKTLFFSLMSKEEMEIYLNSSNHFDAKSHTDSLNAILKAVYQTFYDHQVLTKLQRPTNKQRTIVLDNKGVGLLDFNIPLEKQDELIQGNIQNYIVQSKLLRSGKLYQNISPQNLIEQTYTHLPSKSQPNSDVSSWLQWMTDYGFPITLAVIGGVVEHKIVRASPRRVLGTSLIMGMLAYVFPKLPSVKASPLLHSTNALAIPNRQNTMPNDTQLFDHGIWKRDYDENNHLIFTLHVFKENQPRGWLRYLHHPLVCRSEDGTRHNLLEGGGVLKNVFDQVENSVKNGTLIERVEDICQALPLTYLEKLKKIMGNAAMHGAIRGGAHVISHAFSQKFRQLAYYTTYYGSMFLYQYTYHYIMTPQDMPGIERSLKAFYCAVFDMALLLATDLVVRSVCYLIGWLGQKLQEGIWHRIGQIFEGIGHYGHYSVYAYQVYYQGLLDTVISITTGAMVEETVKIPGQYIVNRYLEKSPNRHSFFAREVNMNVNTTSVQDPERTKMNENSI